MSVEYFNYQQDLDTYAFEDYLNNISPLNETKKAENLSSSSFFLQDKPLFKDSNENKTIKQEKLAPISLPPLLNMNGMNGMKGNMMPSMLPNLMPMIMQPQQNMMPMMPNKQQPKKRKSLAETTRNALNNIPLEEFEETPVKKNKKTKSASKKKKDSPKRKRVNYCFEIHRSGCSLNKDSKLYCKVFLKGKLQSEVDLIKGARGKWAYTFYDQRKKKKERRYWPSQSSGPVIEDPCNCENCLNGAIPTPNIGHHHHIIEEEVDFSSPSTEEGTFVEYDPPAGQFMEQYGEQNAEYQMNLMQQPYYDQGQIVYQSNNGQQMTYSDQQFYQGQMEQNQYAFEYPKNVALKSSNDFQDRNYYLKSSNDYVNTHQRQWEGNNLEYTNDGFFVENNFL